MATPRMMAILVALIGGALIMAAALLYGFTQGDGWSEVATLVEYPWFNVSLVDVYVGFGLFAVWIAYREKRLVSAILWIVALMTLGNLVSCVYAAAALIQSGGDWTRFWTGRGHSDQSG